LKLIIIIKFWERGEGRGERGEGRVTN